MSTSTLAAAQSPVGVKVDQFMRQLCHTIEFLGFLAEADYARLMRVSRSCRLEMDSVEEKWFREFQTGLRLFGEKTSRAIQPPVGFTVRELSIISTRLPQAFDVARPPTSGKVKFSEDGRSVHCESLHGDRCVIGDAPLPTPVQPQLRGGVLIFSPVSYYEVTIYPAARPRWTDANMKQCVSVGVCLRIWKQRASGQQAGWCKYSWGLHGDDGNLFHGSGLHHSTTAFSRPFGPGDTIGCGINYGKNTIFYTLNGELIGEAYSFHGQPFRRRLLPMVGLGTEWTVRINLGEEQFLYRDLPAPITMTLNGLAEYGISNGWVRAAKTGRDSVMKIRGLIIRRLMIATNERDRAIASTLQPTVAQFSSDDDSSDGWAGPMSDDEVFLFGDDATSVDPEDDSDYLADEWMDDVRAEEFLFDIEEEMHDDGQYYEVDAVEDYIRAYDSDFDLIPDRLDFDEIDEYDLIPGDGLVDVDEYDLIPNGEIDELDGAFIDSPPFADVSEPDAFIVPSDGSDVFDDVPVYFEIASD